MKIDIQDIKFWMDAIRNSEDRDRTLETFWGGQIQSKLWLINTISEKNKIVRNTEIVIHGGWNGLLANMLFNSEIGIKKITSVDVDPVCKEIATTVNKRYEMEGKFEAVTCDMVDYKYETEPYIVINTSCEHITHKKYKQWLNNVPDSAQVIVQSNDYYELEEHVNCYDSLDQFARKSMLEIEVKDEIQLPKYKRFMVIGKKK